jgi:cell division septation protein DedD
MAGGATAFFFAARPRTDDPQRPSDEEMFAGFSKFFGSDGSDGPLPAMDPDDAAWLPPAGDGGRADRGDMLKALGFDNDAPAGPGGEGDGRRGFMPPSGPSSTSGGLNNIFRTGPGGGEGDGDGPMAGGAKNFFFAARPRTDDAQASEPTRESQSQPAQQSEEEPPPSFFNPTETAPVTETEAPTKGFFKPEVEPPNETNEETLKGAFFANLAAPASASSSTARKSFFNPGGTTNP